MPKCPFSLPILNIGRVCRIKLVASRPVQIPPFTSVNISCKETAEELAGLPESGGVFAVEVNQRITHLSASASLRRRIPRLARILEKSTQNRIRIHYWTSDAKLHSSLLLYTLAKRYFPDEYLQRLHLRMPWFVTLLRNDQFPRLLVGNRILPSCYPVIGPFPTRESAQMYEQQVQSSFLLRRCTETLEPHPEHPGCIYGEIRQCLRPCQCAVPEERYRAEVREVSQILQQGGEHRLKQLTQERETAVTEMNFETAAQLHKQIEKLESVTAARGPAVSEVQSLNGIALVKTRRGVIVCFPLVCGLWADPIALSLPDPLPEAAKLQVSIQEQLKPACTQAEANSTDLLENLAVFSRWYHSSWREGTWFPFSDPETPPTRKLARAVRRLGQSQDANQGVTA